MANINRVNVLGTVYDVQDELLTNVTYGDLTYRLSDETNKYWGIDGTKKNSSAATCTSPIYLPKGWQITVSTGGGSSMSALTLVTEANAYVSTVIPGSCVLYTYTATADCYVSVSSLSTQLPDLTRVIKISRPNEIGEDFEYTTEYSFTGRGFRYGYYKVADGAYTGHQSLITVDFPVQPGDCIKATIAAQNNKYALYFVYDDGTTEYTAGTSADNSTLADYEMIAKGAGRCYISTYHANISPSYEVYSLSDQKYAELTCRIFKKVVCCGDSYTAGWISDNGEGVRNNANFNFPHYMSTLTGNEWVDAGASGTTALTWQTNVNGYDIALASGQSQAYVIGFGINDRSGDLGTAADIGTDAQTYYGGISQIIAKLAAISPNAPIFVNTNPNSGDLTDVASFNEALRTIVSTMSANYRVHLIDLARFTKLYHRELLLADFLQGHFTAAGYEQFSEMYAAILSYYINLHITEFQDVAFLPYEARLKPESLDDLLTDSAAVALTTSASNVQVYGKYLEIGSDVYFKMTVLATADITSSVSDVVSNLPAPSNARMIFAENDPGTVKQKPTLRYASTRWSMTIVSGVPAGQMITFCGKYAKA